MLKSRLWLACVFLSMGVPAAGSAAERASAEQLLGPKTSQPAATALTPPPKLDLFEAGEDGYTGFRIPGVVVTAKGTVLCYCAARKSGFGDWVDIDVALRRSTDGGKTFSPKQVIADVGTSTVDNPTAIVDHQTGAVHILYQVDYARCYSMRSDDDGASWTRPREITATFEKFRNEYDWNVIAPGPGHGIQLKNGRLLVPVWLSTGGKRHRPSCVATIYSDDHGETWQRGQIVVRHSPEVVNPSETIALELADGRVMLNIRNESENRRRLVSYSQDGATGWTKPEYDDELFEPVCMASIARLSSAETGGRNRILFANPNSEHIPDSPFGWCRARQNLCVRMSYDEGKSWPVLRVVEPGIAGYSDMAVGPGGEVYLFYERGGLKDQQFHTAKLTLARLDLAWLIGDPKMQLRDGIELGGEDGLKIGLDDPPAGLHVLEHLGLIGAAGLSGKIVHRAWPPPKKLFETRATVTPGGDYLLMFPEGEHYHGKQQKVNRMLAYRSEDRGRTWQGPTVAFDIPYNQHGFVPLVPKGTRRLYCFGTQPIWQIDKFDSPENAAIGYRWSEDDGRTWSALHLIEPENDPGFMGMSVMRMAETGAGSWIIGSHTADWSRRPICTRQYFLRSEDRGKTWSVLPGERPGGWFVPEHDRMDEGRPISLGGARLFALMRTCQGHLWQTRSQDDGRTWSDPSPTPLVHPDAPPMLFMLSDGKTLAAFHHNRCHKGHFNHRDRSEVWVAFSTDGGAGWSEPRLVFANALEPTLPNDFQNYQCSYLDAFVDGETLHIFLPHRWRRAVHLTIHESDLRRAPTLAQVTADLR